MAQRRGILGGAVLALLAVPIQHGRAEAAAEEVRLTAADGVAVFGRYQEAGTSRGPLLLLFHQAGSSKDEYAPLQPWLAAAGYASLAIDQRAGSGFLGGRNETVRARGNRGAGYEEAYADLEVALAWAGSAHPGRTVVLCGSSYSAALVFLLAAAHRDRVAAVLAFSPGEYLGQPDVVRQAAARVTAPVFVTSAADPAEEAAAAAILAAVPAATKEQYRPAHGIHGAATLREDADPQGAAANRAAVLEFLGRVAPAG